MCGVMFAEWTGPKWAEEWTARAHMQQKYERGLGSYWSLPPVCEGPFWSRAKLWIQPGLHKRLLGRQDVTLTQWDTFSLSTKRNTNPRTVVMNLKDSPARKGG